MLPHAIGSTIGYVAKVGVVLGVISRQGGIEKQRLLTIPCQFTGVRQCVHFIEQIDIEIDIGYKKKSQAWYDDEKNRCTRAVGSIRNP